MSKVYPVAIVEDSEGHLEIEFHTENQESAVKRLFEQWKREIKEMEKYV